MSEQFKNDYHVYLYKYNYDKIKNKIQDLFSKSDGTAYQYLFESFTTDLYSLGIPSDKVLSGVNDKKTYADYVAEYKAIINKSKEQEKSQTNNVDTVTYTSLDNSNISPRIVSQTDNILQQALAQNYALQMLQKDYEDGNMTDDAHTHWLNTGNQKETYQAGITQALTYSKKLLDDIFKVVINDLKQVQAGAATSEYVTCIDLTDLSSVLVIEKPVNERTKNSCDNFLNSNISNRLLSDDVKTDAISNISSIQTSIDSITNTAAISLRQDVLLKYNIVLETNDVIEISSVNINKSLTNTDIDDKKNPTLNKNTQFIGFITKLSASSKYGQVQDINIVCEGISKMLSLNPSVSSNAINPQFDDVINFVSGKDKTQDIANVNVYETFYSGKTVYDIYSDIIRDVLGALPLSADEQNYTVHYISSPDQLLKMPYQYCKSLLVLYHMAVSLSTIRECGSGTDIVIAQLDCNIKQTYLEAYLSQLRGQYNLFWSTYVMPIQVLQSIISASFLEIFEDRSGVLIMRTPRYNTWYGNNIIELQDMIEWHQSINDIELKSRADYQWSIEFNGQMSQLPGGAYQSIPTLLKYGFRADSPQSSPNAQSEILCAVFGALNVTKANGKTRELTVVVPAINNYKLGRLYYIPVQGVNSGSLNSVGCVGYLSAITTNINPGQVDNHTLTFTYVRNAELIKNLNSTDNYGYILNFTHLPDLEILLSKFDKSMIGQNKNTAKESAGGLVAYTNKYWAQFNNETKKLFDKYVDGTISVGDIDDSNYEKFDLNTAPTTLSKSDFRKYNGVDNTTYQPTQQLINDIWYIDMLIRCGENINSNLQEGVVSQMYTGLLRSKENEKNFLEFLKKDKTIKNIDLPAEIDTPYKKTYIAHVNNFLVRSSLKPSFMYGINASDEGMNEFNIFMILFKDALAYIKTLKESEKTKYLKDYYGITDISQLSEASKTFTDITDRQDKIVGLYDACQNSSYVYYNLFNELNTGHCKKDTEAMLKEYNKYVQANEGRLAKWKKQYDYYIQLFKYLGKTGSILSAFTTDKFLNWWKSWANPYSINNLYKSAVSKIIPAVCIKGGTYSDGITQKQVNFVKDAEHPPILDYAGSSFGTYATGISPVDYTQFFKENVIPKIKDYINANPANGVNLLSDKYLYNANGTVLGTITGLTINTKLSSDMYIMCSPTVQLEMETLKKIYDEEKINSIIKQSDKVYIVIGPTSIPESKIPTIQQIAHSKGLFVSDDKTSAVSRECIFDPSVIYTWTERELEEAITATIYNNIGKPCENFTDITNNLDKVKCVYTQNINLGTMSNDIELTHDSISQEINALYNVDDNNRFIKIKNIKGTTHYKLEDYYNYNQVKYSKAILVTCSSEYLSVDQASGLEVNDIAKSSVDSESYYSDKFQEYVLNRESVVKNIYKDGNNYINYASGKLYPLYIIRQDTRTH